MTMATGTYGIFVRDSLGNTKAIDMDADSFKYALVTDSYTPNFSTHDEYADITNEISGTGYTATGATLASSTWAISGSFVVFDANDTSWASSTLTAVRGAVLYDDTIAADPLVGAVTYGADYATSNGTLLVTHSASGIWRVGF
jgi:hypothetical protein